MRPRQGGQIRKGQLKTKARGGTGSMATDNREDKFGSHQRGEETSRLETRLERRACTCWATTI